MNTCSYLLSSASGIKSSTIKELLIINVSFMKFNSLKIW